MEGLAEANLNTPWHSTWVTPSKLVPRKGGTYRSVVGYLGLNKQKKLKKYKKHVALFQEVMMWSILCRDLCSSWEVIWCQDFQKWLWKGKSKLDGFLSSNGTLQEETTTNWTGIFSWSVPKRKGIGLQRSFLWSCPAVFGQHIVFRKTFEGHLPDL